MQMDWNGQLMSSAPLSPEGNSARRVSSLFISMLVQLYIAAGTPGELLELQDAAHCRKSDHRSSGQSGLVSYGQSSIFLLRHLPAIDSKLHIAAAAD